MDYSRVDSKILLLALFLLALAARLIFVTMVPVKPISGGDPWVFEETALNLLRTGVPSSQEGLSPRGPLYSFFIAAIYGVTGKSHLNIFIAQAILGALSVIFLFLASRRHSPATAVTSAMLLALHPLSLFFTEQVLTESFYTFFLILIVCLALVALDAKWQSGLLLGVVMGAAVLTRAEAVILCGLVLLGLLFFRRSQWSDQIKLFVGVAVAITVTVLPWLVRNHFVLGGPAIATEGGITLYMGHHPDTTGGYFVPPALPDVPGGEYERSVFYYQRAVDLIVADPVRSVLFIPRKLAALWKPNGNLVLDLADWLCVPLALFGFALSVLDRTHWRLYYFFAAPVLAVHVTSSIFVGLARYRTPVVPFLMVFAAVALVRLFGWIRNRINRVVV